MPPFSRFRPFLASTSAVGAVEFALIAPLLFLLYGGSVDVTRAVIFHQRLLQTTTAINDLVSQATELKKADIIDSFTVADVMMSGYPERKFAVKVSGVVIDAAGVAKIDWSVAQGMTAGTRGQDYLLPASLRPLRSQTLIVTETTDRYLPLLTIVSDLTIPMKASARGRSRGRVAVGCSDCN